MALQPGDKLQNLKCEYTIVQESNRGRFGITYEAQDNRDNKVAIKTILDDMYDGLDPDEIKNLNNSLNREGNQLKEFNSPHIVKFKDSFTQDSRFYLVMEYIEGKKLTELSSENFSEADDLSYIRQIGEALTELHKKDIFHLDVKPANIIIKTDKKEAVLVDFGLAIYASEPSVTTRNTSENNGFAPLELYKTFGYDKIGTYTDVYGLAATLYFLVTEKEPPSAYNLYLKKEKLIVPNYLNENISDGLKEAIKNGMRLDPTERTKTIEEWLDSLPSLGPWSSLLNKTKWKKIRGIREKKLTFIVLVGLLFWWIISYFLFKEKIENNFYFIMPVVAVSMLILALSNRK